MGTVNVNSLPSTNLTLSEVYKGKQYKFNAEIPLVEILEQQVSLTQNDVELTYALRPFERYSEEMKAAIWLLFSSPSGSLLRDVGSFMRSKIVKRMVESNASAYADYDLLVSDDFLTIDQECEGAVVSVALFLNKIKDDRFDPDELVVVAKSRDPEAHLIDGVRKIKIVNSTWMATALVESVIYALVHSGMRFEYGIPEMAIKGFMKSRIDLPVHLIDFAVEKLTCVFDRTTVVEAYMEHVDYVLENAIKSIGGRVRTVLSRNASDGIEVHDSDYRDLEGLLNEASGHSQFFLNVLYCYLYPDTVSEMFDAYMRVEADEEYLKHGGQHLEAWISNEIINKSKVEVHNFKVFAEDLESIMTESQMIDSVTKRADAEFSDIKPKVYSSTKAGNTDRRLEDGTKVVGYLSQLLDKRATSDASLNNDLDDLAAASQDFEPGQRQSYFNGLKRNRDIASTSEVLRVVRAHGVQAADENTNVMADLFPDQYEYFFRDRLVEGLVHESCKKVQVRSNVKWISDAFQFRYQLDSLSILEVTTTTSSSVFDFISNPYSVDHAPIFLVDCNKGVFNPNEDECGANFSTTWTSPYKSDMYHNLTDGLSSVQKQMRTSLGFTGLVVVPLIIDPRNYALFLSIITNASHNVEFILPQRIHETHIFLKIWAVDVSGIKSSSTRERMAFVRARKVASFLTWHSYYVKIGIVARHNLWRLRMDACVVGWKTERYKHLKVLGVGFNLDSERKVVVRRIITKVTDRFHENKMGKIKKRAFKKAQLASTLKASRSVAASIQQQPDFALESATMSAHVRDVVADQQAIQKLATDFQVTWDRAYHAVTEAKGSISKAKIILKKTNELGSSISQ